MELKQGSPELLYVLKVIDRRAALCAENCMSPATTPESKQRAAERRDELLKLRTEFTDAPVASKPDEMPYGPQGGY